MKTLALFLVLASSLALAQTQGPPGEKVVMPEQAPGPSEKTVMPEKKVEIPQTAGSHSVTLTWNASDSSGIVNYLTYRGTVSGGPYTLVGTVAGNVLTFVDTTVSAGATYYYVETAKDSGLESGYSNQVQATIPADVKPNPPINLTAVAQ